MAEEFARLAPPDQADIFGVMATKLARPATVLEKDYWVCVVLQALFEMPGRKPMAFKGGTSLSKVYNAIARFSEDIDVTIDYTALGVAFEPFLDGASRSQMKKCGEALKASVCAHVATDVRPYLKAALQSKASGVFDISIEQGEKLRVAYPSVLGEGRDTYVSRSVLLEFGGRNVINPNAQHTVAPDIAKELPNLHLPAARVVVLAATRTFWEKATLIHVACSRGKVQADGERQSRHWYDLAMLADREIGRDAVQDRRLLGDVVKLKKMFFDAANANYDACLSGELKLVPSNETLRTLRTDYKSMIDGGMFIGEAPAFDWIIERLTALEDEINALTKSDDDRADSSAVATASRVGKRF